MSRHVSTAHHVLPALGALLLTAYGCQSARAPLQLSACESEVRYAIQTPEREAGAPQQLRYELFAVAAPPSGVAVANAARAIVSHSGTPFRGRSRLPIGSLWLAGDDVARWLAAAGERDSCDEQQLGAGTVVTTSRIEAVLAFADSQLPQIRLRGDGDTTSITLTVAESDDDAREDLPIAAPLADAPVGLFVPDPRIAGGGTLLLLVPGEPPSDVAIAAAEQAAAERETADDQPNGQAAWQLARDAIGERNRRPALLALAGPLRLDRIVDLVLAADERALIAMGNGVPADAASEVAPKVAGWRLEQAIWTAVMPRLEREELTPAMHAAIERHLGALLHDPATLRLLLQTAGDLDAFEAQLDEQNLAALDDRSTAVRCIAQRWLKNRNIEVADYDALADRTTRRLALRRHRQQEAAR